MEYKVNYERWKRLYGYPDYMVSTSDRVKSFRTKPDKLNGGRIIKGSTSNYGYKVVGLVNIDGAKNLKVHRLVAMTFVANPDNKETVNHIDGNKANNSINNLEWNTLRENIEHAFDNGLCYSPRIAVLQFTMDGDLVREFESINEAVRQTGIDHRNISRGCNGTYRQAGGYIWKFRDN